MIKHNGDYLDATCPFMYPILKIYPTISAKVDRVPSNASIDPFSRTHVTRSHLVLYVHLSTVSLCIDSEMHPIG